MSVSPIVSILERDAENVYRRLDDAEVRTFERYAAELIKWNGKVNLTAITDVREIAVKHFIDSLAIVPFIPADAILLDIGSGAGLPAIPLKIVRPDVRVVSVDAVAKKIHFQRHIIRLLNLHSIEALHTRVEELHMTSPHVFSVITSRAFTRLDRFVALADPLLADGGMLIAMKGDAAGDKTFATDTHPDMPGYVATSIHPYTLPEHMGKRVLTFIKRCQAP